MVDFLAPSSYRRRRAINGGVSRGRRDVRTQEVDEEGRHAHDRLLLLLDCGTESAFWMLFNARPMFFCPWARALAQRHDIPGGTLAILTVCKEGLLDRVTGKEMSGEWRGG